MRELSLWGDPPGGDAIGKAMPGDQRGHNPDQEWKRTSRNTLRKGDWLIVKFPWGTYCLWCGEEFVGRFSSAEEAKEQAK